MTLALHRTFALAVASFLLSWGTVMADPSTEREAVLKANAAFYAAFAGADMDKMEAVWGKEGPVAVQHPSSMRIVGRAAVMESWRQILRAPPAIRCTVEEAFEADGTWGVICQEDLGTVVIRMINLFHQEDGAWKMIYHGPAPKRVLSG